MSEPNNSQIGSNMSERGSKPGRGEALALARSLLENGTPSVAEVEAQMGGDPSAEGVARTAVVFDACTQVAVEDVNGGGNAAAAVARGRAAWEAQVTI